MVDPLDIFGALESASDPLDIFGDIEEDEEERRRREQRERIRRNMQIGAEQAARLDLPEPEPDYRRDQPGWLERQFQERSARQQEATEATVWGDFGGGLADLGAAPGTLADTVENVPLPYNLQNLTRLLPDSYREEAREVSGLAEYGREHARIKRFEAGMDSPTLNALTGVAAENPDILAGGVGGGLKGVRALSRAADFVPLIDDAVKQGVRQGAGGLEAGEVAAMRAAERARRPVPWEPTEFLLETARQRDAESIRILERAERKAAPYKELRGPQPTTDRPRPFEEMAREALEIIGAPAPRRLHGALDETMAETRLLDETVAADPLSLERLSAGDLRDILKERNEASRRLGRPTVSLSGTKQELLIRVRRGEGIVGTAQKPPTRAAAPGVRSAMAHAGSASSPEAISRMRGGTKFYQVSPGGEVMPIIGVDAVDVAPKRGYAKVRVSPSGEIVTEQGRLTDAGRKALETRQAVPVALPEPRRPPTPTDTIGSLLDPPSAATPPPASRLDEGLPFEYSIERLGLSPEAGKNVRSLFDEQLGQIQAQRRAGATFGDLEAPERLAQKLGITLEDFLATPAGKVYNFEEAAVLDATFGQQVNRAMDLARQVDEGLAAGDDVTELKLRLVETLKSRDTLAAVSVGNASETGRALGARTKILRALSDCFGL